LRKATGEMGKKLKLMRGTKGEKVRTKRESWEKEGSTMTMT